MKKISLHSFIASCAVILLSGCASQPASTASTNGAIPLPQNPPGNVYERSVTHSTQPEGIPVATANMPGGGIVTKLDTPASMSLPVLYGKTALDANRF